MEIFEMDKTESVNLKDHHFDLLWICCTTDCTTNSNKSVLSSIIGCQHDATRIAAERGHLKPSIGKRYAAPAAIDRCMQPTPALSSKLAARRCGCRSTGQRDGRTPDRYVDAVPHTMCTVSIMNLSINKEVQLSQTSCAVLYDVTKKAKIGKGQEFAIRLGEIKYQM